MQIYADLKQFSLDSISGLFGDLLLYKGHYITPLYILGL